MAASLDRDALVEFSTIGYKLMPPGPLNCHHLSRKGQALFCEFQTPAFSVARSCAATEPHREVQSAKFKAKRNFAPNLKLLLNFALAL
jgi:hypothetical protein